MMVHRPKAKPSIKRICNKINVIVVIVCDSAKHEKGNQAGIGALNMMLRMPLHLPE